MAYLLGSVYQGLTKNHREHESTLLPTLGLGNTLTLLRGVSIGLLAGFLFLPQLEDGLLAWTPAFLYTSVIVLDYLDGYAARATNHVTKLGEMLDSTYDVLAFLVAVTLAVGYGRLSAWYLTAGLAFHIFSLGRWWRQRQGRPIFDLPSSQRRRLWAGFQMTFVSFLLWPLDYPPGVAALGAAVFILPVLVGFWRDWLVVSGRWDVASPRYLARRATWTTLLDNWLPPLLRGGSAILALVYLLPIAFDAGEGQRPLALFPSISMTLLITITTLMLTVGVLTRVAALGLLIPTFMTILVINLSLSSSLLLAGLSLLMLLGGGKWALWKADDGWVTAKAGTPK